MGILEGVNKYFQATIKKAEEFEAFQKPNGGVGKRYRGFGGGVSVLLGGAHLNLVVLRGDN